MSINYPVEIKPGFVIRKMLLPYTNRNIMIKSKVFPKEVDILQVFSHSYQVAFKQWRGLE